MIQFKNYRASGVVETGGEGSPVSQNVLLLAGTSNGTIVKSLEIITEDESSIVHISRVEPPVGGFSDPPTEAEIEGNSYASVKVDMKAHDYLVLWEGFFVVPANHRLYIKSTSTLCTVVANVVEMT